MTYSSIIIPGSGGAAADTEAPSAPALVLMTPTCQTTGTITWKASTDNVGVTGYKIYRNGVEVYDVAASPLSKAVTGLTANTSYTWTMKAYDAASNLSAVSNSSIKTQPPNVYSITLGFGEETTGALACVQTIDQTFYKTVNSTITSGHTIYMTSCATEVLFGGNQYWSNGTVSFQVSSVGVISNINFCT